jgi:hypothetical protein
MLNLSYNLFYQQDAVGALARVHIQQPHMLHRFYLIRNLFNDIHVLPLAEIGNTFNDLLHAVFIWMLRYCLPAEAQVLMKLQIIGFAQAGL